jgi:hypothetical protein
VKNAQAEAAATAAPIQVARRPRTTQRLRRAGEAQAERPRRGVERGRLLPRLPSAPQLTPMALAVGGTALVAGGAAVLNQVYERDTDA